MRRGLGRGRLTTRVGRAAPRVLLIVGLVSALTMSDAAAAPARDPALPQQISAAAHHVGVDADLLAAIVWVESRAWPWAINVNGQGYYPHSRAQAAAFLERVGSNVDIGYGQVNYQTWGATFGLRKVDLLDPWTNLIIAARILRHGMEAEPGSWRGVARYHSASPERQRRYLFHAGLLQTYATLQQWRARRGPVAGPASAASTP